MKKTVSMEKRNSAQDDLGWLAEVRDALSPYWAARLQFQPVSQGRVQVVQVPREQVPPHALRMIWPQD
jgi:hypothetical protein